MKSVQTMLDCVGQFTALTEVEAVPIETAGKVVFVCCWDERRRGEEQYIDLSISY